MIYTYVHTNVNIFISHDPLIIAVTLKGKHKFKAYVILFYILVKTALIKVA